MNQGFGKVFCSMFTGSMVGSGPTVFAVMTYAIANMMPPDFEVELNRMLLATILGTTEDDVKDAIDKLCAPDPNSRTPTNEGRRLKKVGSFRYQVINADFYRKLRNYQERKEYNRVKKQESRERQRAAAPNSPTLDQCKTQAQLIDLHEAEAIKFFNHYESIGWMRNGNPIRKWELVMDKWKENADRFSKGDSRKAANPDDIQPTEDDPFGLRGLDDQQRLDKLEQTNKAEYYKELGRQAQL